MPTVRRANPDDLPAIAAIVGACPSAPQWSADEFGVMLASPADALLQRPVLVVEDEGAVAGFAVYTLLLAVFPPDAELESLAVAPAFRRRGLAAALLQAAIAAALAAGAESLTLEVRTGNAPALALYDQQGFQAAGIRKGYYASPTENAVVMQLPLAKHDL